MKVQTAAKPTPAPSVAPTAAATATPAASAAAPGTSGNPAPGTSGNPAPGTSGNPAPGTSENPNPGTSGDPTQAPSTPTPVVESQATEIKNIQLAGELKEFVRSFEVKDGAATLEMSAIATYDHVYTYFDYKLPADATLDDILAVKFDYNATGKDCDYKSLCVLAGDPETFPMKGLSWDYNEAKPGDGAANVNGGKDNGISTGSSKTETNLADQELPIIAKDLKKVVSGDTVRFCIYLHIQGAKDDVNTKYTLSNIKVMSKKDKAGTNVGTSTTKIDNTQRAEAVAAASVDTMKIEAEDTSREITITVPKTEIEGYGVTVSGQKVVQDDASKAILDVKDSGDGTYTVKLKSDYKLPEGKAYVTTSVKVQVSLNTGGTLVATFDIVVGDDSVMDVKALLKEKGLEEGSYTLVDLHSDTDVTMFGTSTIEKVTKSGVKALTVTASGAWNHGIAIKVDETKKVEKIVIIAASGDQLVVKGGASDKYPFYGADGSAKTEEVEIGASVSAINIASKDTNPFDVYAVAVVYAK